jgi:t-SNARE complex subunit (syntaxin)
MENEEFEGEIFIQERINAEKAALLREIEEKNNKINLLYQGMGELVGGEQRDLIDRMDANMVAAKQNVEGANENLDEARKEQKKAGKKYTCVIIAIVLGLVIGAGVLIIILTQ